MKKCVLLIAPTLLTLFSCVNGGNGGKNYQVSILGEHFTSDCPTVANSHEDLKIHLNIEYHSNPDTAWKEEPTATSEGELVDPNVKYYLDTKDIEVKIGGVNSDKCFTFIYQTNNINELTIKKKFITDNIEIRLTPRKYEKLNLFGYLVGSEKLPADQLEVSFSKQYQKIPKRIRSLGEDAYPVYEGDSIDVDISSKSIRLDEQGVNLWYRRNARWTKEYQEGDEEWEYDFKREFSNNGMKCHIHVPYFKVDDHGSFKAYGDE